MYFLKSSTFLIILSKKRLCQEKYGFEIGTGEHVTWNNEADVFKHAYMPCLLSWYAGDEKSKLLGNMHEDEMPNAPWYERNTDL